MRGFSFKNDINPDKPLNPNDPPPSGWRTDIDTNDYRKALFGFRTDLFERCCEWEKRELKRLEEKNSQF